MNRAGKRGTSTCLADGSTERDGGTRPQRPPGPNKEREDAPQVRRVPEAPLDAYVGAVGRTMDEWNSKEDETAWRDL